MPLNPAQKGKGLVSFKVSFCRALPQQPALAMPVIHFSHLISLLLIPQYLKLEGMPGWPIPEVEDECHDKPKINEKDLWSQRFVGINNYYCHNNAMMALIIRKIKENLKNGLTCLDFCHTFSHEFQPFLNFQKTDSNAHKQQNMSLSFCSYELKQMSTFGEPFLLPDSSLAKRLQSQLLQALCSPNDEHVMSLARGVLHRWSAREETDE